MEIRISRCATRCHACEHDFVHEQKVHSVARMEQETLVRLDYCAECRPRDKDGALFCSWETRYNDPKILEAEQQETLSPLRRLFYDLADSNVRIDLAQAFLAAQLLKRQRAFRQIRESQDGEDDTRTTLYLDRAGNRLIETRDLNFSYAELDEARIALVERLRVLESPEVQPDLELDSSLTSSEDGLTAPQQTPAPNEEETMP